MKIRVFEILVPKLKYFNIFNSNLMLGCSVILTNFSIIPMQLYMFIFKGLIFKFMLCKNFFIDSEELWYEFDGKILKFLNFVNI